MESKKQKGETAAQKKRRGGESKDKSKYAKRPMSAFFLFSQSFRDEIKKNGGSISGIENVAKMAGKKWRELSEAQKQPYATKALEDRERFERELASGLSPPPRKMKAAKKRGLVQKDPNKPKRASSSYLFYMADFRKTPEAGLLKHTEIMKVAAEKWKSLTDEDKKKYVELEKKDKQRFQREMVHYKAPVVLKKSSKKAGKAKVVQKESSDASASVSVSGESDLDDEGSDDE